LANGSDPSRQCFGCGADNTRGLGLRFELVEGRALARYSPEPFVQGYPGLMHGGAVATLLDEAMGWAAYWQGLWSVTAKLNMRFRRGVPLGQSLSISGWVTRDRGRFIELRAELRNEAGELLAEADGVFARMRGPQAEEVRRLYEAGRSAG
jgi:acyl-coenzyme A thioesterase PaaI-like protein